MAAAHLGRLGQTQLTTVAATIAVTLTQGAPAGSLVVVAVKTFSTSVVVSSVADNRGNTYTVRAGPTAETAIVSSVLTTALEVGDVVTVTQSGSNSFRHATVDAFSGLTSSPFQVADMDATQDNDTSVDSPSVAVTAPALIFGATGIRGSYPGRTFTAGSGFAALPASAVDNGTTYSYLFTEWRRVAASGNYVADGSLVGGATVHRDGVAVFTEQATGGPPSAAPGGKAGPGKGSGGGGNRPRVGAVALRKLRLGGG